VECSLAVDNTSAWSDYVGDSVSHQNGLSSELAAADRQLAIDLAMADAQFLVDGEEKGSGTFSPAGWECWAGSCSAEVGRVIMVTHSFHFLAS